MRLNLQICPIEEKGLFYSDNYHKSRIGYLRGDFGSGKEFFTTWFDTSNNLKTNDFKTQFQEIIDTLRTECDYGILENRRAMENFLYFNPSYKITEYQYSQTFGVKIDTKDNTYYLRCNPAQGDYEFYCFCYNAEMLKTELSQNLPQSKPHKRQEAR